MTTLDFPASRFLSTRVLGDDTVRSSRGARLTRFGVAMVQLHNDLWRITRTTGEVLGYVEAFPEGDDLRYRAKRMRPGGRPSLPLGEFWNIDDAVDCFRFS